MTTGSSITTLTALIVRQTHHPEAPPSCTCGRVFKTLLPHTSVSGMETEYGGGYREAHASGQSREAVQVVERERGGLGERVEDQADGVDAARVLLVAWEVAAPGGGGLERAPA